MSIARNSLDAWKQALDHADTGPLAEMLAEKFFFENTECEQENKESVLAWTVAGGFTIGDWVVYHEDESTICGTRSMTPEEGPALSIMYFADFEVNKCVFWKVHSHLPK